MMLRHWGQRRWKEGETYPGPRPQFRLLDRQTRPRKLRRVRPLQSRLPLLLRPSCELRVFRVGGGTRSTKWLPRC